MTILASHESYLNLKSLFIRQLTLAIHSTFLMAISHATSFSPVKTKFLRPSLCYVLRCDRGTPGGRYPCGKFLLLLSSSSTGRSNTLNSSEISQSAKADNTANKSRKEAKFTARLNQSDSDALSKMANDNGMLYHTLFGNIIL